MLREWCPKCQLIQNLNKSISTTTERGKDNKKVTLRVANFNCSICGNFIKSEIISRVQVKYRN